MGSKTILRVQNLCKTYPVRKGDAIKAVDDISFDLHKGEILGLLGPNGAGKTTTVKMICSLIKPDQGKVVIDDIDNFKHRSKALGKISAVLEGNRNIYWRLTVRENLEFFSALKGRDPKKLHQAIDDYIELFNLKEKEHETARHLSRGMQQKLAIAVAMVSQSEIVLLDEPTLGLDVKASYEIRDLLKKIAQEDDRTIILTTHDMNVVQDTCERVIIINKGKIVAQDRVDNLMRLFQVKSYEFVISDQISKEQRHALSKIPYLKIEDDMKEVRINLNLEDPHVLYKVTDILGKENTIIESINRKEINFERVFMEILGRSEKIEEDNPSM